MTGQFSYVSFIWHTLSTRKSWLGMSFLNLVVLACIFQPVFVVQAASQDGTVDPTFKSGAGPGGGVRIMAIQSDGKVIIGGGFTTYGSTATNHIARLNPDGSLDTTFDVGSGASVSVIGNCSTSVGVNSIAIQNDGKILIGGQFTRYNGASRNNIARLNADGSLDTTFNTGSGASRGVIDSCGTSGVVNSVSIQSDGKVLIGGWFTSYNGVNRNAIARLNSDGSLDTTSFSVGTDSSGVINSIVIQSDGKILIGGQFSTYSGVSRNNIARLNADGSLDTTFNTGSGAGGSVNSIAVQSDSKVLIVGQFIRYNGIVIHRITRLNSDGSLDTSFNGGIGTDNSVDSVFSVAVQSDGKILIGGQFGSYNGTGRNNLARLNSDGSLDTTFNMGSGASNTVLSVAIQNDGKVLIGGHFVSYNGTGVTRIARINADGTLDTNFNTGGSGANNAVTSVAVQNDGKVLIGGAFSSYNGVSRNSIARLNSDGSLDTSFDPASGAVSGVQSIAVQSDGKILIAGVTNYNGTSRNSIVRLNSDGSLDTSFNGGSGISVNSRVRSIVVQSDGKILIGGAFSSYNEVSRNNIARLNADGTLDASFNGGSGANDSVNSIAIQNDGKILIGGRFTSYDGVNRNSITRLNSDGSLDTTFNTGGIDTHNSAEGVYSIAVQNDGKALIGGYFGSYNGVSRNNIVRLNSDGSLDTSFNTGGSGANYTITSLIVQSDGKIFIGGHFTSYNGIAANRIAWLNNDGSLANSFNMRSGTDGSVFCTAVQKDNKILIGGDFRSVDNYTRDGIARLEGTVRTLSNVALVSDHNPTQLGQSVTFSATVSPITATGTVMFTFGQSISPTHVVTSPVVSGIATYVTNTLPVGNTLVRADYSGDNIYGYSSTVYTQSVTKLGSSLNITSSANPALVGTNLTFTATLTPLAASGVVTFTFEGNGNGVNRTISSPVINGVAEYITNTLAAGTYTITASYGGDASYKVSNSIPYIQKIVGDCTSPVVTSATDDGKATTCGTFSYILAQTTSGTITFGLIGASGDGNTITFTSSLTSTLKAGVAIDGGASGIVLNGNGVAGDGLRLGGNNTLTNLTIKSFGGQELLASVSSAANQLFKVKVQS